MPNYFSLDIIDVSEDDKLDIVPHDTFSNYSGFFSLTLIALTPIFVGSGDVDQEKGRIYSCFTEVNDVPVIPGPSLKGVIRSLAEALSPSCLGGRDCSGKRVCPACGIFGTTGYLGRICVFDARLGKESENPKESENAYEMLFLEPSWKAAKIEERKFYASISKITEGNENVRSIRSGTTFTGKVKFSNLKNWELGLLFLSMGLSSVYPFPVKIGGKKDKGLGTGRIEVIDGRYSKENGIIEDSLRITGNEIKDITGNEIDDMVLCYLDWAEKRHIYNRVEKNLERLLSYRKLEGEANADQ